MAKSKQQASVGRIVHYTPCGDDFAGKTGPFAAIITEVTDEAAQTVSLTVFHPTYGACHYADVAASEIRDPRTWTWPVYVPEAEPKARKALSSESSIAEAVAAKETALADARIADKEALSERLAGEL